MDNELLATAYHEAGHAVIAYIHGRRFKRVSIEPNEDFNGVVEYYDGRIICEILEGSHCNIWLLEHPDEAKRIVERSILSALAGHISQDIGVPGSVEPDQWEADREYFSEALLSYWGNKGWDIAEVIVRQELNDNWHLVERLVQMLIEKKTLSGKEAYAIWRDAYLKNIGVISKSP